MYINPYSKGDLPQVVKRLGQDFLYIFAAAKGITFLCNFYKSHLLKLQNIQFFLLLLIVHWVGPSHQLTLT